MKKSIFCLFTLLFAALTIFPSFSADASVGDYLYKWGSRGPGDGQFYNPRGVAVDGSGHVYVADTGNDRIQVFDSDGNYQNKWGSPGPGDGQFGYPVGVAVDASGHVYVADLGRIQVFDSDGNYQNKWGSHGSGNGQFNYPFGVAVDASGHVYVADTYNNRIQVFDSDGNYQNKWGSYGSGNGQFNYPSGVAVDASGNIYVADTCNNRIQVFDSDGNYQNEWGSYGLGDGQFYHPYGVAVDASGHVYVADTCNHRIQVFDSDGNYQNKWGSPGPGDGRFGYPVGVAVDASGHVYVADLYNFRIQVFEGYSVNQPPLVDVENEMVVIDEGLEAANIFYVSDPDDDPVTLTASLGTLTDNGYGTWSWSFATNDGPAESQTVTITADDGNGGIAEKTFELTVNNVAPSVDAVYVPLNPVPLGTGVYATADFSDPGNDAPYTCNVNYGDGSGDESGTVDGFTCTGPYHMYDSPGVYTVSVTVTDKDGGSGSGEASEYIVIYDAEGGFVTGGGWIESPEGACPPAWCEENTTGKATFGFVSKYKKGASIPTGQTQFQFKAGDLKFHSDVYDWLVVTGPHAKFKGTGTINGGGNYGFMLTATDSYISGGGDVDAFRIKIWDKDDGDTVVYDNKMGEGDDSNATTARGGGNIKIHKGK